MKELTVTKEQCQQAVDYLDKILEIESVNHNKEVVLRTKKTFQSLLNNEQWYFYLCNMEWVEFCKYYGNDFTYELLPYMFSSGHYISDIFGYDEHRAIIYTKQPIQQMAINIIGI